MKSPWKFLAQLTSRRRPAEPRENSIERDADTAASESQAQQTPALPLNPTETFGRSGHGENQAVEPLATTTSNEAEREVNAAPAVSAPVDADAHALLPERETSKKPPRTPRTKKPGRAKRTRTDMVAQSPAVANRDQSAQPPSSREAFFDEVAGLDEEIKQLRIQLAQKLHLQNVQLKKMLERFDVS